MHAQSSQERRFPFERLTRSAVGITAWIFAALMILLIFYGIRYTFFPVRPPTDASLAELLDSVAEDIHRNRGKFKDAKLRIKEATIEVNLGSDVTKSFDAETKKERTDVHAVTTGKGQSSHKLIVVLEREPDPEPKIESASTKSGR